MRIRFDRKTKKRGRTGSRRKYLLAGSFFVLLFCITGLVRYGVNTRRSADSAREFRELHDRTAEVQTLAEAPPGAVIAQYAVAFPGQSVETKVGAATVPPIVLGWPDNPSMKVSVPLQKLRQRNRDVIGWLSIPDMLAQAVVQRDNSYYLKRDYLGYHNDSGSLFLEEDISLQTRPDTYIIFGHNMKTGQMFGSLRLFEDVGYYRRNALIEFDTLYEDGEYVVFSVSDVNTVQYMRHYVPFMQLPGMEPEQRADCIRKLQAYSWINSPIQVDAEDQLLLLVTCDGTEDGRRVVAARRLRDGENTEIIAKSLESARKRKTIY